MDPVPLIFSCDTEDYETPAADEAELLWARMFARHGIRACFCVVGEEARALRDRGRRDVLAALAGHEIASHSDMHSAHPTPAEYLEPLSWEEGVRRFLAEEGRGVRDLRDLLGQQPSAWCKPGNSWGAAVPYAAGLLGMPVFCDAPFEWAPGRPLRYAGGLLLRYHTSFDRYFNAPEAGRFELMRADMEALLAQRQEEAGAEGRAPGGDRDVHPPLPHRDRGVSQQLQRREGDPPRGVAAVSPAPGAGGAGPAPGLRRLPALDRGAARQRAGRPHHLPGAGGGASPAPGAVAGDGGRGGPGAGPGRGRGPAGAAGGGGARALAGGAAGPPHLGPGPALGRRGPAPRSPPAAPAGAHRRRRCARGRRPSGPVPPAGGDPGGGGARGPAPRARPARWGRRCPAGRGWGATTSARGG